MTLIGPNGSGKSTILKSITKQLTLIGGKVTIGEKNLKDLSYKELATKMAVVLTQRAKPELMTCYEVVAAGRYPCLLYTSNQEKCIKCGACMEQCPFKAIHIEK